MKSLSERLEENFVFEAKELSKSEFLKIKDDMKASVAEKMYFLEANAKVLGRHGKDGDNKLVTSYYEYEGTCFETIVLGEGVWNVTPFKNFDKMVKFSAFGYKFENGEKSKVDLESRKWRKANGGEHIQMYTWAYPSSAYD